MKINIEDCYKKYAPMVFRRCLFLLKNEDEALDAAQDVFVNLLRSSHNLHGKFLSSLMYTIATNICLNKLRRRKFMDDNCDDSRIETTGLNDPEFDKVESRILLETIFENESESTRAICFMYHRDGMTLREIGDVIGMSISGVRKRLTAFNARVKIKMEGEKL